MDQLDQLPGILEEMQAAMLQKSKDFREHNTIHVNTKAEMEDYFKADGFKGFVVIPYAGTEQNEKELADLKISIRCLLPGPKAVCAFTHQPTEQVAVIARAY